MDEKLKQIVLDATGASAAFREEVIQSLWSGYGEIVRIRLHEADVDSVILKHVIFPTETDHPRGWNSNRSHQRKVHSYEVEMTWYHDYAARCGEACRVPNCLISETIGNDHIMILEDLDAAGYPQRRGMLDKHDVLACLKWLAHFHAEFMGENPDHLWPVGTYWHLATRPDELEAMHDNALKEAAPEIDRILNRCRFKTFVHGDAKVANFCFSRDGSGVAAVDFQYVGGGCGMKDVAYLLGSCLDEQQHESWEPELLNEYFRELKQALAGKSVDFEALEREWRSLYPITVADFHRFLLGWMPSHWKVNDYNSRITREVIARL